MKWIKDEEGFSLAELLIVMAIMGILATVVILNLGSSDTGAKEVKLRANLKSIREALVQYRADHGYYPCAPGDNNTSGNQILFRKQMTWYTDAAGAVSASKTDDYRFGPYLPEFPHNPFYAGNDSLGLQVNIDVNNQQVLQNLRSSVAAGSGNNGWHYEAKSGYVVPNLGGSTFSDNYCYY